MMSSNVFSESFSECIERANKMANRILPVHFGGHTNEDVVAALMEKLVRSGKSQQEIEELLQGPQLFRSLVNMKNDIFDFENADMRNNGETSSLDQLQGLGTSEPDHPFCQSQPENPEIALLKKEGNNLLTQAMKEAHLSKTEFQIITLDQKGYTTSEICDALGLDRNTVYVRRSDAQKKIVKIGQLIAQGKLREAR